MDPRARVESGANNNASELRSQLRGPTRLGEFEGSSQHVRSVARREQLSQTLGWGVPVERLSLLGVEFGGDGLQVPARVPG